MEQQTLQGTEQPANYMDAIADAVWGRNEPAPRDEQGKFVAKETPAPQTLEPQQQEAVEEKPVEENQEEQVEAAPETQDVETVDVDPDAKWIEVEEVLPGGNKALNKYSLNELKAQRMMQADYTRKTQELAAQRRQIELQASQSVSKERQDYLQTLAVLQQTVIKSAAPELQNVNWSTLAQENPAEYVRLSNRAREVQEAVQALQQEQAKVQQVQQQERQQRLQHAVEESRTKIKEAIPEWNDELYQGMLKTAVQKYGYAPEEVSQIYDHRFIKLLHDASRYGSVQETKPIIEKKLVAVPKMVKPGTQQRVQNKGQQELNAAKQRLSKTGSVNDLADVMGQFLKG